MAGLTRIDQGVWTDTPERAGELVGIVESARAEATRFFRMAPAPDRMILCAKPECARTMGLPLRGITYGKSLVVIGPDGLNTTIVGHELSHVALHENLALRDLYEPRFPAWFSEGLAVYLFPDPQYRVSPDPDWIRAAKTPRDWRRMVTADNWPDAYGNAGEIVRGLQERLGDETLRELIATVAAGEPFEAALKRLDD